MQQNQAAFTSSDEQLLGEVVLGVVSPRLRQLLSRSQPHFILACLFCSAKYKPDQIAEKLSQVPFNELVANISWQLKHQPDLAPGQVSTWVEAIIPSLAMNFSDLLDGRNLRARQRLEALLSRRVGDTTLAEYLDAENQAEQELVWWAMNAAELPLIAAAQDGDTRAFDRLQERYASMLKGAVSVRMGSPSEADDVAQETWIRVWQHIQKFDPARGTFGSFIKFSLSIILLRHFSARRKQRRFESLFADIIAWFPDIDSEDEVVELLQHSADFMVDPLGAGRLPPEILDKLLRMVFLSAGQPHHAFSFGYIKLLHWTPTQILEELSLIIFEKLIVDLRNRIAFAFDLESYRVVDAVQPLQEKLQPAALRRDTLRNNLTYSKKSKFKNGRRLTEPEQNSDDIKNWWNAALVRIRVCLAGDSGAMGEILKEYI